MAGTRDMVGMVDMVGTDMEDMAMFSEDMVQQDMVMSDMEDMVGMVSLAMGMLVDMVTDFMDMGDKFLL